MTYVAVTTVVLLILNIYCSNLSKRLFYQSKETAMREKCQLTADEIATLDVLNSSSVSGIVGQMESLNVGRLIVTDQSGLVIYDSASEYVGRYTLFPEILKALDGNDVFSWNYRNSAIDSRAATPILYYGTTIGCVYMTEYDTSQAVLLLTLQSTVLRVTLLLELVITLFSIGFSRAFSHRLSKIMRYMRIIQEETTPRRSTWGGMMS